MRSFWLWFSLLLITWVCSVLHISTNIADLPWRIAMSALFFALYFISPLFRQNPIFLMMILSIISIIAIAALWPESTGAPNLFPLLVYSIIAGEAMYRLSAPQAAGIGVILLLGSIAPYVWGYSSISPLYIGLYSLLLAVSFVIFRKTWVIQEEVTARNEALLSEYRKMKRQIVASEQAAREEERAQVGRDIHDSVGHKLTALLMQLEVFRMQTDEGTALRVQELKELASESLEETRSAVKTLRNHEAGGLTAIVSLIRKLESESFFRINFSVRHGALSAPLSNTQSIAVYRSVQEALKNIMRHSNARDAEIIFEAPGGGVFRFEVINKWEENKSFREGFGLRSMRERMELAGGRLDVIPYKDRFVVRGTLSMVKKGGEET
jgi:signal transduction histidine kinase